MRLLDFIDTLEHTLGKKAKKKFMPMQAGDVYITYADVSDLAREFGYRPTTTLQEGIGKFASWYREYYKV